MGRDKTKSPLLTLVPSSAIDAPAASTLGTCFARIGGCACGQVQVVIQAAHKRGLVDSADTDGGKSRASLWCIDLMLLTAADGKDFLIWSRYSLHQLLHPQDAGGQGNFENYCACVQNKHGRQEHTRPLLLQLLQGSFPASASASGSITTTLKHFAKRHTVRLDTVDTMTVTNADANQNITEKIKPLCPQVFGPCQPTTRVLRAQTAHAEALHPLACAVVRVRCLDESEHAPFSALNVHVPSMLVLLESFKSTDCLNRLRAQTAL